MATFDQTQLATTTFHLAQRNATHSSEASDNFPKHTPRYYYYPRMATATCSSAIYGHAFRDPVPAQPTLIPTATTHAQGRQLLDQPLLVGGGVGWSTSWALPEPEPELRQDLQLQQQQRTQPDGDEMAMDDLPTLEMGEMDGLNMMDFLPELELGGDGAAGGEALMVPWESPTADDIDSPSVFRCDSPDLLSPASTKQAAATAAQPQPQHQQQPRRVQFGASNRVRTIPAVVSGVAIPFAFGVPPPDTDVWLKENDGPSRSSAMVDLLLRAYFEHGATSSEYMQHVLGAENCAEIAGSAAEIAGLCWQLAEKIDRVPEGGAVGVLPSNTRLGAAHAPGVRMLAQWMWSC